MTLDELIAREGIRKTLARYTLQGDRGDIETFLGAFTQDAVLEFVGEWRAEGHAGIRSRTANVTDLTRERRGPLLRHHLGTHGVEFESGTRARAWTYFTAYTEIGPDHTGRYVDQLRREGEEWLIEHRRIVVEWWSPDTIYRDQARRAGARLRVGSGGVQG
jgi:hypothetical protein